jgi:alpha-L-rhamnosidase
MAERPDGDEPHMLSFNHYAYGAVIDWVYRHVAGLAPDVARPGYRHVVMAPRPVEGIDRAAAAIDSPFGRVATTWRIDAAGTFSAEVELPFGTSATFVPPVTGASVVRVDGQVMTGSLPLGPGRHGIAVSAAEVVRPRAASVLASDDERALSASSVQRD